MASGTPQLLRKPVEAAAKPVENADTRALGGSLPPAAEGTQRAADPHCLLDATAWELRPAAVASQLSARNADFAVVGALGGQGLGKSSLLNKLLGFDELPQPSAVPPPAFTTLAAAAAGGLQHCTRGVQLRVSDDRLIGLDTQPLFAASVLEEIARWEAPPSALAAPAVAAASDAKAGGVPLEGALELAQLQLAVLLLTACNRVLVLCDGLCDRRTWELVLTAEMLARGVPDPTPPPAPVAGGTAGGGAGGAPGGASQQAAGAAAGGRPRQAPAAEHLAEVVFVHVQLPGAAPPTAAQLQALEARLDTFFASSRLRRPGPLRMREHLAGSRSGSGVDGDGISGISGQGVSYWVLPALQPSSSGSGDDVASGSWGGAGAALVVALLSRPAPPFARRCSELGWLRGVAGDTWRAVRKSPSIAAFYSRLARTQLKGAAGWGLAR